MIYLGDLNWGVCGLVGRGGTWDLPSELGGWVRFFRLGEGLDKMAGGITKGLRVRIECGSV